MQTTFQSEAGPVKPSHSGKVTPLLSTGISTALAPSRILVLAKDQVRDQCGGIKWRI